MKKIVLIFMIFFFSLHSLGLFFIFKIAKWHIHTEVSAKINSGSFNSQFITKFSLSNIQSNTNEFEWENEHEFMYRGQWYDVLCIKDSNNTQYYYCIKDLKETQLIALWEKMSDQNTDNSFCKYLYNQFKKLSENDHSEQYALLSNNETLIIKTFPSKNTFTQLMPVTLQDPPPERHHS